jgi:hypothetical protein
MLHIFHRQKKMASLLMKLVLSFISLYIIHPHWLYDYISGWSDGHNIIFCCRPISVLQHSVLFLYFD